MKPHAPHLQVHRVEVRPAPDQPDPRGDAALAKLHAALPTLTAVRTADVYLVEAALDAEGLETLRGELLVDPISQVGRVDAEPTRDGERTVEVHYLPGVMDPVAGSVEEAASELLPGVDGLAARTAVRYDLSFRGDAPADGPLRDAAQRQLANPVVQRLHLQPHTPEAFVRGEAATQSVVHVPIRQLDDGALAKLSREAHLFLSLEEMRTIQAWYARAEREPTDIELETLAQTWSEHCVHKTLKSTIHYIHDDDSQDPAPRHWLDRPGHTLGPDGVLVIDNLLRSTIAAATRALLRDPDLGRWCVSVFEDNAGIVRFDEEHGVAVKVETHNHPSALEPYGGAATGIGGCIRDIMGVGLAARPIANTDVFAVAPPDAADLPAGVIHPRRILEQVVAGVRDYGNRMGIPTLNGSVVFHPDYAGNPLVFAGCVGLIPLERCFGEPAPGDRIIVLGGRTGRDGIHGATFSSAELTGGHADEFAHAVQIGNAITQKKVLDVILAARDAVDEHGEPQPMFRAITDCGAGGFSSAVGEMGEKVGATVTLETAPLKYAGLSYTEIWISEAQERMVLAVPPDRVDALRRLCRAEDVEIADLGAFGKHDRRGEPELVLTYDGRNVGRLPMRLVHEGLPMPVRRATWASRDLSARPAGDAAPRGETLPGLQACLLRMLGHPNIASKHWIVRQYDHEVQGGAVVRPLVGMRDQGPSDAAVIRPKLTTRRGVAIAHGLTPLLADPKLSSDADPYWMALAAIDEAVRNACCVGADPARIAILDNFCWPCCDDAEQLGALVRAAEACYDGALAYATPFVSGKDSLNNQFTADDGRVITIPPTLLISAVGIVADVTRCVTMDAKHPGDRLVLIGESSDELGGSHLRAIWGEAALDAGRPNIPRVDLKAGPAAAACVAEAITRRAVHAAHDVSDGGLLVAAAEMAFAGETGLELDLAAILDPAGQGGMSPHAACFGEAPSRYLLEIESERFDELAGLCRECGVACTTIGTFNASNRLTVTAAGAGGDPHRVVDVPLAQLHAAWRAPLDW